jgi:SET domain-containing protein
MTKFTYKPLPKGITIGNSTIQGLGLFSTDVFAPNTILGISHHIVDYEIIRTPLGGFLNHANKPNCELVENGNQYILRTLRNILPKEELTVKYSIEQ